jgi:hypothetical protein
MKATEFLQLGRRLGGVPLPRLSFPADPNETEEG